MLARGMVVLSTEAGALREQSMALMGLGLYALPEDPRESVRASMESAEVARRGGLRMMETTNLLNAAETMITMGEWAESRRILGELTALDAAGSSWGEQLWAMLEAMAGDTTSASARIAAIEASEGPPSEFVAGQTTLLHASAMVDLASGNLAEAKRKASLAVELDPVGINAPVAVHLLGRASLWLGDLAAAKEALAAGEALLGRWITAVNRTFAAGIAALEGRTDDAADRYAAAFDLWRALDDTLSLALAELDCLVLLGPNHPVAVAGKEARDVFAQLGALPFLERLETALTATTS
jgi:tetratricopeptide (TPR) repeat protein